MPFVALSQGHVHYHKVGQGLPIVCLHANPGDSQDFAAISAKLAQDYCVITLDWPGFGLSPQPANPEGLTAITFAELLAEFVEALNLPPCVLMGNSVGGFAATSLAITQPARVLGLILVSPAGFTPHNVITRLFCRLQGSRFSIPPALLAALYLRRSTEVTQAMRERARTLHATPETRAVYRALWRSFADPDLDLRERAQRIEQPTLLFFGKFDPLVPAFTDGRSAAQVLDHAEMHVTSTGHAVFAEQPEWFLNTIRPFLAKIAVQQQEYLASAV